MLISTLFFIGEARDAVNTPLFSMGPAREDRAFQARVDHGFLAFWNVTPNFSLPLYYHITDQLQFEQGFIGLYRTRFSGQRVNMFMPLVDAAPPLGPEPGYDSRAAQ